MSVDTSTFSEALAQREYAMKQLRKKNTAAREAQLLDTIGKWDGVMYSVVSAGADIEAQRANGIIFQAATDQASKRSLDDVCVFDSPIGETRDAWISDTSDFLLSDVLSASGKGSRLLPLVSQFPFTKLRGRIPTSPRLTAEVLGRNQVATASNNPLTAGTFEAVKASSFVAIDRDELTGFPVLDTVIRSGITAALGQRTDALILNGGTTPDVTTQGIVAGAANKAVTVVDAKALFEAQARVQDTGADASAVIARPSEIAKILATVDGRALDRLPDLVAIPDLADGTVVMPVGKILVADLSSVSVAIRNALEYYVSTNELTVYSKDQTLIGARTRVGSAIIAAPGRVQALTVGS